jgi:hypothetical protein
MRNTLNNANGAQVVGIIIAAVILIAAIVLIDAWLVMLLWGALAHIFGWSTFLSFGESVIVTMALSLLGGFFKTSRQS